MEFGWRLAPEYRGLGYASEASQALLDQARRTFIGEVFVIIDPDNLASHNVARKLGSSRSA
ncbi:MAG TPA: GNAT family N-acetyltransferase [Streptosporangiaceae bacterium]